MDGKEWIPLGHLACHVFEEMVVELGRGGLKDEAEIIELG